ncbi:MAG: uroporphyrinogen decarboxylase family protein [Phycisphaerae bacterium]|nr:uroporphyrinogen decarboxylase family protein [Phycisphaerae bacterium]
MTEQQWRTLLSVINGEKLDPIPIGFIIDSPWLPNWAGMSIKEYYDDEGKWLEANLRALRMFPDIMFLPGFWSEYGMCTEPSAFGSKCVWQENDLPFAETIITDNAQIQDLQTPDARTDGLAPLVIDRLSNCQQQIEAEGHAIRFAVSRGPLNLATFLMGNTEFFTGLYTDPEAIERLLEIITEYTVSWMKLQMEAFPTIDGIFVLDDIVGFINEDCFLQFAKPYLERIYQAADVSVRFFHNDAPGMVCAPHLSDIGVNLFNFGFEHGLAEMKELTGGQVTLLGNIPPRDVLAAGTPDDVKVSVAEALASVDDHSRIILSCGGGMPPGVSTENIEAFRTASGR